MVHHRNHNESQARSITSPLVAKSHDQEEGLQTSYQATGNQHLSMDEDESRATRTAIRLQGRVWLLIVAFLYGSLNVCLRLVYEQPGPPSASALSSSRGWLAAACFVPLLVNHRPEHCAVSLSSDISTTHQNFWWVASELALFNFGAQGLLTIGLFSTESARASFFTQTSVVMTPVLSACAGHRVHWRVWLGCLIALAGLTLLSANESGSIALNFSLGDSFCLAGAFCWSFYIFRLSALGSTFDEIQLQGGKTLVLAVLYSVWFVAVQIQSEESLWPGWTDGITWALIFYSAIGPGTLGDIVQQKGQATVSAAEANVILSMEPVFTAVLGLLLLGEATTWQEKIGGGLIIGASILSTTD